MPMNVPEIVGMDDRPILRNLRITHGYYLLSLELAQLLGSENANWCTFATWASKTAGGFVRREEVPSVFRPLLRSRASLAMQLAARIDPKGNLEGEALPSDLRPLGVVDRITVDVSEQIAAGNLKVFEELAPLFSEFIRVFSTGRPSKAKLGRFLGGLRDGPSSADGQTVLAQAFSAYYRALVATDPNEKAQQMLLANALTGLHEQIRLQPFISGGLRAPVRRVVSDVADEVFSAWYMRAPRKVAGRVLRPFVDKGVEEFQEYWLMFLSDMLMTLDVPGERLRLGRDLPAPSGRPLFPSDLQEPNLVALQVVMDLFGALTDGSDNAGADDWSKLSDRMRYIIELFRSRQQVPSMMEPPFSPVQQRAMMDGQIPQGRL